MTLAELNPTQALQSLLKGNIKVAYSETSHRVISVYSDGEMPNKGLAEEFVALNTNGAIRSMTYPIGAFRGDVAVSVHCASQSNGTVKLNRIASIIEQIQTLCENATVGKYHFKFTANSVITPPRIDSTNGYAIAVLNLTWSSQN